MKMAEVIKRDFEKELYTCAQCGYCQDVCPIYTEIPWESASPRGKIYWIQKILSTGFLRPDIEMNGDFVNRLFQCTLCGQCHEVCQTMIDTMKLWNIARAEIYLSGLRPKNLEAIADKLEETGNPYGLDADMRLDWADFTGLEEVPVKTKADIAYFVGCTTAFKGVNHNTAYATSQLLNHLNEDWTLLSEEEWCCGSPLLMVGDVDKAKEFAKHNIEEIERRSIKTLLTGCSSCYRMWKFEIPEILGKKLNFTVEHSVQYILHQIDEEKITLSTSDDKVTYHDPCELSRLGGVLDEPRNVLKSFTSNFVEMPEHGVNVRCCGGGGLLQATDNNLRLSIAKYRLEQAKSIGAEILTSCCPACKTTFLDALRVTDYNLEVLDVTEFIAQQLGLI